jgi:hypothetical protein
MTFFSTTLTPTTANVAQPLMTNKMGIERATQIQINIRSMGTATYVAIGGTDTQDRRLTGAGDNLGIDTPQGKRYMDLKSLFIVSDTNDAVIEIVGDSFT